MSSRIEPTIFQSEWSHIAGGRVRIAILERGLFVSKRDQKKHQKEVKRKQQAKDRAIKERMKNVVPPREIRGVLIAADRLRKERDYDEAENVLTDAIRRYPRNVELLEELLSLQDVMRDHRGMEQTARQVVKLKPNDPDANLILAQSHLYMQRYGMATNAYREFLNRWPQSPNASKAKNVLMLLDEEIDGPLQAMRLTREELPILAMHDQVVCHISASEFVEAAKLAEELIGLKPDLAAARNNLSMSLFHLAQFERAQSWAKDTVERFPENLFAQSMYGTLLFLGGRLSDAKEVAANTTSFLLRTFDPESKTLSDGIIKLVELLSFLGDDEQVVKVVELADQLTNMGHENRGLAHHYRAVAFLRLDRGDEALASWESSKRLLPSYSLVSENLLDLHYEKGHAPWPFSLGLWIPASMFTEIRALFKHGTQKYDESVAAMLRKWPQLKALIPELLDRGDPGAREFAIAVARADQSPEMMQALLKFATGRRGPEQMRLKALEMLRDHGVIDDSPITFFSRGQWTEVGVRSLDVHWNPTLHPDSDVNDLISECYIALSEGDVERSLELSARCVEADPDYPACLFHRVTALKLSGTAAAKKEAREKLENLRQRFPEYGFALISLALDALDEKQWKKAEELLKPLATRTSWHGSEYVAYAYAQAKLCVGLGRIDAAQSIIDVAKEIVPDDLRVSSMQQLVDIAKLGSLAEPLANPGWRYQKD